MTDCAALVTTASQESCAWRVWAEQRRKGGDCVSISHSETDGHENSAWYGQEYSGSHRETPKPLFRHSERGKLCPNLFCLVWWEDLNSASSCLKHSSGNSTYGAKSKQFSEERKREASPKLLPNLGLSWTGQRLNKHLWPPREHFSPQTSAALLKSHCCVLLQGGAARWGSWAQTNLESQNLDLVLTRPWDQAALLFFCIYIVVVSVAPSSAGSWGFQNCQFAAWGAGLRARHAVDSSTQHCGKALKSESLSLSELRRVLQEAWNQTLAPRVFVQGFDHKPIFSVRTILKCRAGFCPRQENHCAIGSICSGGTWDREDAAEWWNCTV